MGWVASLGGGADARLGGWALFSVIEKANWLPINNSRSF